MYLLLTILIVIASVLLVLIVLVQNSKGGGLSAGFSSSNQVLGVRKTTDFLEKATWSLVAFVVVFSVIAAGIHTDSDEGNTSDSLIKEQYQNAQQEVPGAVAPNFGETPEAAQPQPEAQPQGQE